MSSLKRAEPSYSPHTNNEHSKELESRMVS